MALRRCLRTDFLLGFRHQIADALDCTGIELLGPSIGDQSANGFSSKPSARTDPRAVRSMSIRARSATGTCRWPG
jgi:hypothetical protein